MADGGRHTTPHKNRNIIVSAWRILINPPRHGNAARSASLPSSLPWPHSALCFSGEFIFRLRLLLNWGVDSDFTTWRVGGSKKTASAYSPLPHIIGSEEFIHDNSCGITENLSVRNPLLDFGLIVESKQASSTAEEPPDLFGPDLFGIQGGSSGKVMADPLASAATDFKAMLEAALLNPYKFYDETLPVHDVRATKLETGETNKDVVGSSGEHEAVGHGTYEQLNNTAEEEKLVAGGNVLPDDTHAHDFYSALVGGSLFDTEEDLLSFEQKDPAEVSSNVAESSSSHFGIKDTDELPNDTHSSSINTAFCDSYEYLIAHADEDNLA